MRLPSVEKLLEKSRRMTSDFFEIINNGRREDYYYSDANRECMRAILNNPGNYSEDDKINTLLSFHKDTCANVLFLLYPSFGDDDVLCRDAFEDLEILKKFETVLSDLEIENRQRCLVASYKHLRVKLLLLKMKAAMLESPQAKLLPEDIKKKLECDDDYGAEIYDNDTERLQGVEIEQCNILADLQRLGVDKSEYQDSDGDGDEGPQFMGDQPITQATINQYKLLEQEVIERWNKMVEVLEDVNPIAGYISVLKRHTEIMERGLTASEAADDNEEEDDNGIGAPKQLVETIQGNLKGCSVGQFKSLLGSLNGGSSNPQDVMNALIDALFGGVHKGFSKEVMKKKNYLAAATHDDEGSQILLLQAIDSFCENSGPEVVKEIALVLKTLYDGDVLEEEHIVQWYNEGVAASGSENSKIWKNVKPFIVWLQTAESESESE
ncbi:hypothetical protein MKW98_015839 [Papaver atlanticum]|uniref:W2 domain-containing protein n=1 Tax=Papaver atlanticum TaxID=357466 RepID=A0AAD4SAH4_9MAGN|nr:hypothetical protein MKW98_015839 [Papaver atlanticum]